MSHIIARRSSLCYYQQHYVTFSIIPLPVSSVAQRVKPCFFYDDPARMIWGCKIQLSNILALLGKWTLQTNFQVIAQTLPICNNIFIRHISQHHAIIRILCSTINDINITPRLS